jgi:glycine cleavage system pyridoxal-binding protein P
MLEDAFGRLVAGALWGAGATVVLSLSRGGNDGLRPIAKTIVKGAMVAADRLGEMTAEARESLNDLYAEARAEREQEAASSTNVVQRERDAEARPSEAARS